MTRFYVYYFGEMRERVYICIVFFMVLDLRLTMKIGCRETTIPFFIAVTLSHPSYPSFSIDSCATMPSE